MKSYLLSIIIPTKNRYEYLKECVKTIIDIGSQEIEIVIQDNTEENDFIKKYFNKLNSPNLKYFHSEHNLSQTENSELAVTNSTGEYVCYIGDDDSVAEIIVGVTMLLKKYNIEACNVGMSGYYWPDVTSAQRSVLPLSFDKSPLKVSKIPTKKKLEEYLLGGMQEIKFLPRVYHGIVSRKVLDKIKSCTGNYFPGPSPDMANACATSLILDWHIMIRLPIVVSGTAFKSAAGKGVRGDHKGELAKISQLANDVGDLWDPKIPKVWLGNTIWPESCLKALSAAGADHYLKLLNYYPIYARICLKHREYIPLVKEQLSTPKDFFKLAITSSLEANKWLIKRLIFKAKLKLGIYYVHKTPLCLAEACTITNEHNRHKNNLQLLNEQLKRLV